MDPLTALSLAGNILQFVDFTTKVIGRAAALTAAAGVKYRRARFGIFGDVLYATGGVDTDALQELHWKINIWTDAEVMAWKGSHLATCNAIAVAGAIFATLGLTALLLPNVNSVHWSCQALFISSMILGILSVTMATSQQQAVGQLNDALTVRLWLSRGRPTRYFAEFLDVAQWFFPDRGDADPRNENKYHRSVFEELPLESSMTSLKIVALPKHLLDLAVTLYIIGFGLYALFLWLDDINQSGTAYRNIFIVFIITVGLFAIYFTLLQSFKTENESKKAEEFDLRSLNSGWNRAETIRALEMDLARCQRTLNFMRLLKEESEQSTNPPVHVDSAAPGGRSTLVADSSANNASRVSISEKRDPTTVS